MRATGPDCNQLTEVGPVEGLVRKSDGERVAVECSDGEADAVDRDRVAEMAVVENRARVRDGEAVPGVLGRWHHCADDAHVLDQTGEH